MHWVFEFLSEFGIKNQLGLNPIPTGLGHVTLIYGLIPPMAGRNRVKKLTLKKE